MLVQVFRRFLPRRGADGKGLVQFYGLAASRTRPAEDRTKPLQPMKPGSLHRVYPNSTEPWSEWRKSGPKLITADVSKIR